MVQVFDVRGSVLVAAYGYHQGEFPRQELQGSALINNFPKQVEHYHLAHSLFPKIMSAQCGVVFDRGELTIIVMSTLRLWVEDLMMAW